METKNALVPSFKDERAQFELACKEAGQLNLVNNAVAAFAAVEVVAMLRAALTDEVMEKVFMPLMNTKIGFLTDRNPNRKNKNGVAPIPYPIPIVRDAIIDAVSIGLLPTGNQFNIIAERMYPTKEGYTSLLRKMGVKYIIDKGIDSNKYENFAEIPCKINYQYNDEKNSFTIVATVKKDAYASADQLRGKAERQAKKALYEYLTGVDYGDADTDSARVEDAEAVVIDTAKPKVAMAASEAEQQAAAELFG